MNLLLLLLSLAPKQAALNLEDLGFFEAPGIRMARMGDRFVFSSNLDVRIVVTDKEGRKIAAYSKTGQGPDELDNSHMLGVWDNKIFMSKDPRGILVFDQDLKLLKTSYPPLPFMAYKAQFFSDEKLRLLTIVDTPYRFTDVELNDGEWKVTGQLFTAKMNMAWRTQSASFNLHGGLAFYMPKTGKIMAEYSIEVHEFNEGLKKNIVQVIGRAVDDEPEFPNCRPFFERFSRLGDQFTVNVIFVNRERLTDRISSFVDVYTANGDFIKRHRLEKEEMTLPVDNRAEVFVINSDTMILKPLLID